MTEAITRALELLEDITGTPQNEAWRELAELERKEDDSKTYSAQTDTRLQKST